MERTIFIANDNIISSIGTTTNENITNIINKQSGLSPINHNGYATYVASPDWQMLDEQFLALDVGTDYTSLEKLFILSIMKAIDDSPFDLSDKRTILVISTTKGNIDALAVYPQNDSVQLWMLARKLQNFFAAVNTPLIVCHACVSGVMGIMTGAQLIKNTKYDTAVISGGDIISDFVLSGFCSFKAVSSNPCRPYDKERDGLNLGEACGTLVLTSDQSILTGQKISYWGGASSNDANHISGPSRDGKGLYKAVMRATMENNVKAEEIDAISAHGTATPYNDEMEAKAFTLAKLNTVPLYSLKGLWGHTLGAAGIIETIAAVHSMKKNTVFATNGYANEGVSKQISVSGQAIEKNINIYLKTASGFGGSNAGILLKKWNS